MVLNREGTASDPSHGGSTSGIVHLVVPGFLRELRRYGHLDANGCLNCGACTVACDLSGDSAPFPRRAIQYAIIGLDQPLLASLAPWLCHDCRDCSSLCPRQAEPGESMATLRRYLAARYDRTGLSARIFRSRAWEIGALSFTALLVLAIAWGYHAWASGLSTADLFSTPMGMEHMFPKIAWFTWAVFLLPLFFVSLGAFRMQKLTMRGRGIPLRLYAAELKTMLLHAISQPRMRTCEANSTERRWLSHWLLGLSFVLMSVILVVFLRWFQTDRILPLYHPQRWLGYLITIAMVAVPLQILVGRRKKRNPEHRFSEAEDVMLPILLLLTATSGIAVHLFRYLGLGLTCHFAYAVHLAIAVPLLVVELPFGKLSHALYRPLAIWFQAVKERAESESAVAMPPAIEEARVA